MTGAMTLDLHGDLPTYRVATIPGDGVGPEVVAAARRVVDAVGARFGFAIDWSEHVVGGAAIDAYGVAIRDEDLDACRAADAILLGAVGGPKWSDPSATVRPEQALFASGRARAVRQPPPGQRASDARRLVAAPAGAARRRRYAHRPRTDRRDLFRRSDRAVGRARRAHGARHAPVCGARDQPDRAPRLRAGPDPSRCRHPGRQGERARHLAALAAGDRRDRRRVSGRTPQPPARRFVRHAADPATGRLRRHRHGEPVRRHPVR